MKMTVMLYTSLSALQEFAWAEQIEPYSKRKKTLSYCNIDMVYS